MNDQPRCFFADWDAGPCDGRLIRAHLIPRQLLKREFPHGVIEVEDGWRRANRYESHNISRHRSLQQLIDDPASWVPCCGGINGSSGHHGAFDVARTLRIHWGELPLDFLMFCDELGLGWYHERTYRPERGVPATGEGGAGTQGTSG